MYKKHAADLAEITGMWKELPADKAAWFIMVLVQNLPLLELLSSGVLYSHLSLF